MKVKKVEKKFVVVSILLVLSIVGNLLFLNSMRPDNQVWNLSFQNANSWDTYFSVHHIKEAQQVSQGKGIKVGIIDHYFGCEDHPKLYQGNVDFNQDEKAHNHISEHGYWMTSTLKEIAPKCEVYAISGLSNKSGEAEERETAEGIAKAVDWAIENHINILTYSSAVIENPQNQQIVHDAIAKATEHGIVTTFIHCDDENNIFPTGMYEEARDFTIYSYDFNVLMKDQFEEYGKGKSEYIENPMIFYSNSSMSVVTGGFVAMLMELHPNLKPEDYKNILIQSAVEKTIQEPVTMKEFTLPKVADITAAIEYMRKYYVKHELK